MANRDCPFLDYESGTFLGRHVCKVTHERVLTGSALYNSYCHNFESSYSKCPHFKLEEDKDCYLTSACVEAMGLADDCHELTVLRAFRDGWLSEQPGGREDIDEYYRIAPQIVRGIHEKPNCQSILNWIYENMVVPCVEHIESGRNEEAYKLYKEGTLMLKKGYGVI